MTEPERNGCACRNCVERVIERSARRLRDVTPGLWGNDLREQAQETIQAIAPWDWQSATVFDIAKTLIQSGHEDRLDRAMRDLESPDDGVYQTLGNITYDVVLDLVCEAVVAQPAAPAVPA